MDSGGRAAEALALVRSRPGITIPERATEMAIQQRSPGRSERGKGWRPKD